MSRRADRRRAPDAPEPRTRRRAAGGPKDAPGAARLGRTARRLVAPAVLAVLTIGVLMLGAFPTRTLLDQRRTAASAEAQLQQLDAANAAAQQQADALGTDEKVEELAREYGLAMPGDGLFHVPPAAQDPVRVPDAWPFNGLGTTLER